MPWYLDKQKDKFYLVPLHSVDGNLSEMEKWSGFLEFRYKHVLMPTISPPPPKKMQNGNQFSLEEWCHIKGNTLIIITRLYL
jgi:hypothetical protein